MFVCLCVAQISLFRFRHSGIQTFKHSNIQTFRHSDIQTFRHPDIQTFRHSDIQIFRHSDIQIFRHSDIQTFRRSGDHGRMAARGRAHGSRSFHAVPISPCLRKALCRTSCVIASRQTRWIFLMRPCVMAMRMQLQDDVSLTSFEAQMVTAQAETSLGV